jgi:hypothetical protein
MEGKLSFLDFTLNSRLSLMIFLQFNISFEKVQPYKKVIFCCDSSEEIEKIYYPLYCQAFDMQQSIFEVVYALQSLEGGLTFLRGGTSVTALFAGFCFSCG